MKENNKKNKIKVAFPHMGTVSIVWSAALRCIGVEPYIPQYTSKETLSIGIKYSPEAICLPYKLILGNFIQAIDGGADYVAMISSPGTCRMGEYSKAIEFVLGELGYKTRFIELKLYDGLKGMYDFLKKISPNASLWSCVTAIYVAVKKVFILDKLEQLFSYYRARELKSGSSERVYNKAIKNIDKTDSGKALNRLWKSIKEDFKAVEVDAAREVLHVGLTGEIYVVLDHFSNQDIERELGKMGVEVHRTLNISSFLKDAVLPKFLTKGETHLQRAFRLAKPYLARDIGGDALESVSDVIYAKEQHRDGIIHLSPFTCMPEIMAQNIFPSVREDVDIPVLSLIMDEQTGKAGYLTRLEAFVDLMKRKKRRIELDNIKKTEILK